MYRVTEWTDYLVKLILFPARLVAPKRELDYIYINYNIPMTQFSIKKSGDSSRLFRINNYR